jgi:hypothetical protein
MGDFVEKRIIDHKFWEIKLVHVFIVLPFIIGWSGFFLAYGQWKEHQERDISGLINSTKQLADTLDKLADKVSRMDTAGTYYGVSNNTQIRSTIADSERRMSNGEKMIADLAPKVERIDTNLSWITQWIQAQEAAKHSKP